MDEEIEVIGSPTGSYNKLSDGTTIKIYQDGVRKQAVFFDKNGDIFYVSPIFSNVTDEKLLNAATELYNSADYIKPGTTDYYNAVLGFLSNIVINKTPSSNTLIYYEEAIEFCNIKRNNINDPLTESNLSFQAQSLINTAYTDYISKYDNVKSNFIIEEGVNTKIESISSQVVENVIAEGSYTSDPNSFRATDSSIVLAQAEFEATSKALKEVRDKYLNGSGRVTITDAPGNRSIEYLERRVSDLKGTITKPYREAYVKIKCKVYIPKQIKITKNG